MACLPGLTAQVRATGALTGGQGPSPRTCLCELQAFRQCTSEWPGRLLLLLRSNKSCILKALVRCWSQAQHWAAGLFQHTCRSLAAELMPESSSLQISFTCCWTEGSTPAWLCCTCQSGLVHQRWPGQGAALEWNSTAWWHLLRSPSYMPLVDDCLLLLSSAQAGVGWHLVERAQCCCDCAHNSSKVLRSGRAGRLHSLQLRQGPSAPLYVYHFWRALLIAGLSSLHALERARTNA